LGGPVLELFYTRGGRIFRKLASDKNKGEKERDMKLQNLHISSHRAEPKPEKDGEKKAHSGRRTGVLLRVRKW